MRKRIKLLVIVLAIELIMISICGCGNEIVNNSKGSKKIDSYLNEKYDQTFELGGEGDNIMFSKTENMTYKDSLGNEFTVRCNNG